MVGSEMVLRFPRGGRSSRARGDAREEASRARHADRVFVFTILALAGIRARAEGVDNGGEERAGGGDGGGCAVGGPREVARAVERGVFRRAVGEVSENHGDERHGVDSLDGRVRAGSRRRAERVGGAEQKGADVRGVAVVTRERDAVRAKRRLEARGIRRRQRLAPVRRQARPKRIRAGDRDGSGETREEGSGLLGNRTGRRGGTRAHGRRRAAPAGRARVM